MRKTLLTVHTAIIGSYALLMLAVPTLLWGLFGVELANAGSVVLIRVLGAHVLGNTVLSWMSREESVGRIVLPAFSFVWGIMFVITLIGQLTGAMNALGWVNVATALLWSIVLLWLTYGNAGAQDRTTAQRAAG